MNALSSDPALVLIIDGALPFFPHRVAEAAAFPWNFSSRLRGTFNEACCLLSQCEVVLSQTKTFVLRLACQSQGWHEKGFLRFRVQILHRTVS